MYNLIRAANEVCMNGGFYERIYEKLRFSLKKRGRYFENGKVDADNVSAVGVIRAAETGFEM